MTPLGVATTGTWQQLWRRISPRERKGITITWLMGAVWSTAAVGAPYAAGVAVNQLHRGRGVGGVAVVCCVIAGLALGKALALRVRRFLIFATSSRVAGSPNAVRDMTLAAAAYLVVKCRRRVAERRPHPPRLTALRGLRPADP